MKTNSDEMHNQEMLLKKIRQSSEVFDKLANSYEVWVPESGWLAGRRNRDKNDSKRKNLTDWSILSFLLEIDNCHYPMADSYLQYGIDGVIRIAAETLETLKNNLQSRIAGSNAVRYCVFGKFAACLEAFSTVCCRSHGTCTRMCKAGNK